MTYKIIERNTYALGIEELRKYGQKPLTFKQNIQARIEERT